MSDSEFQNDFQELSFLKRRLKEHRLRVTERHKEVRRDAARRETPHAHPQKPPLEITKSTETLPLPAPSQAQRKRGEARYGRSIVETERCVSWTVDTVRTNQHRASLTSRESLVGTGICCGIAKDGSDLTQVEHAALCIAECLSYVHSRINPDLFETMRFPFPHRDRVMRWQLPHDTSPHIVICYRGNIVLVEIQQKDVPSGERDATIPPYTLQRILEAVLKGADTNPLFNSHGKLMYNSAFAEGVEEVVGATGESPFVQHPLSHLELSRANRDVVAEDVLLTNGKGSCMAVEGDEVTGVFTSHFEDDYINTCLNTASFIVSFCDESPETDGEVAELLLTKGGTNKRFSFDMWCGKGIHLALFRNKKAAFLGDPCVATPTAMSDLAHYVVRHIEQKNDTFRMQNQLWAYFSRLEYVAEAEWYALSMKQLKEGLCEGKLSSRNGKTAPEEALQRLIFDCLGKREEGGGGGSPDTPEQNTTIGRETAALSNRFAWLYPAVLITENSYDRTNPFLHNTNIPFSKDNEGNSGFIPIRPVAGEAVARPFSHFVREFWTPFTEIIANGGALVADTAQNEATRRQTSALVKKLYTIVGNTLSETSVLREERRLLLEEDLRRLEMHVHRRVVEQQGDDNDSTRPQTRAPALRDLTAYVDASHMSGKSLDFHELGRIALERRGITSPTLCEIVVTIALHHAAFTLEGGCALDATHKAYFTLSNELTLIKNFSTPTLLNWCKEVYGNGVGYPAKRNVYRRLAKGLNEIMQQWGGMSREAIAEMACEGGKGGEGRKGRVDLISYPLACYSGVASVTSMLVVPPPPVRPTVVISFVVEDACTKLCLLAPNAVTKPFIAHFRAALRTVRDLLPVKVKIASDEG